MTPQLSDRLKDVQRQYAEMEQHVASIANAARSAENAHHNLNAKCREEIALREQVIASLKYERTTTLSLAFLGGVFGAVFGWFAVAAGSWLWDSLLAALRAAWNSLTG